ncbi:hypothetical protein LGM79_10050 [Burkholderia multivorans]|nr:hypothetical protein [Burkholderia multivorans]MDN7985678.1 hypothetical protein [Burkholderia multivorans]
MDEREIFEAWATTLDLDLTLVAGDHYSDCNTDFAWLAWQAARRTAPDRDAIIEECASIAERTYTKDAFRFELGTEAARAIRAIKTAPTSDKGEKS